MQLLRLDSFSTNLLTSRAPRNLSLTEQSTVPCIRIAVSSSRRSRIGRPRHGYNAADPDILQFEGDGTDPQVALSSIRAECLEKLENIMFSGGTSEQSTYGSASARNHATICLSHGMPHFPRQQQNDFFGFIPYWRWICVVVGIPIRNGCIRFATMDRRPVQRLSKSIVSVDWTNP